MFPVKKQQNKNSLMANPPSRPNRFWKAEADIPGGVDRAEASKDRTGEEAFAGGDGEDVPCPIHTREKVQKSVPN